jgi:hypothetical protein
MASKETAEAKQLRIKFGMCARLKKELAHYQADVAKQKEKVEKMKAEGGDEYDVKKQVRRVLLTAALGVKEDPPCSLPLFLSSFRMRCWQRVR